MPNLWPPEFGTSEITPPVAILREQADHLFRMTNGVLAGSVQTVRDGDQFVHHLVLRAPILDNYTYHLLSVKHPLELYPVSLAAHVMNKSWTNIQAEQELTTLLGTVLTSEPTRKVIQSLLTQSQALQG